ncbi:MAG: hypothetical protein RI920_2180 [Pseudomonadota bacterium]|jgi:uncharacterized protein YbaR (Trm112 family)
MDTRLIELLVCPVCKGPLHRLPQGQMLICRADRLGFPIRDGIPVMLESEAVALDEQDMPLPAAAPTPPAHTSEA